MQLSENQIFDGRYLLVELIGRGASAEVWKAVDTKANNMPVAVKIYKPDSIGPGSAGIAEFQREFTMVYNMTHTNLLHPQGFDIVEGAPYLVMAFCENGSATSMVGRCNEDDLLRFLRDVAAGLEYLHDHNITHQDIKPDNVLVDDNCNFMVTDFGISRREAANDAIGGTRAYMAPEVYRRKPEHASDIWSLGATAIELLDGQPPYGELGGAGQLQNPGQPVIRAKLSEPVKKLITEMLDPDPRKRPSAAAIRSRIEHFRETGSWNRNVQRNKIAYIAAGIASLLLCAGLFVWDINRTKIRYYKDYTEIWGVPHGIGRVSAYDQRHRAYTYKMEYRGGKLRHISRVNAQGNIALITESELLGKLTEAAYFYGDNGQIDYVEIYNQGGECTYIMDYDSNLKTIIFKNNDEHRTEKPLPGKTSETVMALNGMERESSPITRYLVAYDDKGRFAKIEYATAPNIMVTDEDMIHGRIFEYDDRNRIIKMSTIGLDGNVRGNQRALATKVYEYDDDDNWTGIKYLTADGSASDDGTGVPYVRQEYDEYGNMLSQKYYTLNGEPTLQTLWNISGLIKTYEDGNLVKETFVGLDGKPAFANVGYVGKLFENDENGYQVKESMIDENDSIINGLDDATEPTVSYAIARTKYNNRGIMTELALFDKFDKPVQSSNGFHSYKVDLDSVGHATKVQFFGKDGKPAPLRGFHASLNREYNRFGWIVEEAYFDAEGKPMNSYDGFAKLKIDYDEAGHRIKDSYFGPDGKLALNNNGYAYATMEYNPKGMITSMKVFDVNGKPTVSTESWQEKDHRDWHELKFKYDPKTNYLTDRIFCNISGVQVTANHLKYDSRGNTVQEYWEHAPGVLVSGTIVENREYDSNNRIVKAWGTNLSGSRVNYPDEHYNEIRVKYDQKGNEIERSYWSASGQKALSSDNVHRAVKEYNQLNQIVHWLNYDSQGNIIKLSSSEVPEARYEYDARGNQTVFAIFDGNGNPINGSDGYQKSVAKYNDRNDIIEMTTFDKNGKPANNKKNGFAKIVNTYDDHGNRIKIESYDEKGKIVIITTSKYNKRDQIYEESYRDGNGNVPAGYFAKAIIEYEADDITPRKMTVYDINNKMQAYMTWNKAKHTWNDPQFPGQSMSYSSPVHGGGGNWQEQWYAAAGECPVMLDDNYQLYNISVSSSSVYITIKCTNFSKYNLSTSELDEIKNIKSGLYSVYIDEVPGNVSIYLRFIDKAGRTIDL